MPILLTNIVMAIGVDVGSLDGCAIWVFCRSVTPEEMTAEQILHEIIALPVPERERLIQCVRQLEAGEIPKDFDEALADFERQRFVSMETALHQVPPSQ